MQTAWRMVASLSSSYTRLRCRSSGTWMYVYRLLTWLWGCSGRHPDRGDYRPVGHRGVDSNNFCIIWLLLLTDYLLAILSMFSDIRRYIWPVERSSNFALCSGCPAISRSWLSWITEREHLVNTVFVCAIAQQSIWNDARSRDVDVKAKGPRRHSPSSRFDGPFHGRFLKAPRQNVGIRKKSLASSWPLYPSSTTQSRMLLKPELDSKQAPSWRRTESAAGSRVSSCFLTTFFATECWAFSSGWICLWLTFNVVI